MAVAPAASVRFQLDSVTNSFPVRKIVHANKPPMTTPSGSQQLATSVRLHKHQAIGADAALSDNTSSGGGGGAHTALVDSPRRIILEKTILGSETLTSIRLETFYESTVHIPPEAFTDAQDDVIELLEYIRPRIKKFGRKIGLRFSRFIPIGSVFDGTEVIGIRDIDVLMVIDKDKTGYNNITQGYKYIPLKRWRETDGGKPDPFRFGRSTDGSYLSSLAVARNVSELIERSLRMRVDARVEPCSEPLDYTQVVVRYKEHFRVNIIPAIYHPADDTYLVTRGYVYDENVTSDCAWRISHVNKERTVTHLMDCADRGVRLKAYKLLKGLLQAEPTLNGIPTYHVKTVLLHTFDDSVDHMPRWQRTSLESCFFRLLHELRNFYAQRCLPNFFVRRQNLLEFMSPRLVARYESRLSFLIANQREFFRVLKKRSCQNRDNRS